MELLNSFYANFFTVGSLIPILFNLFLAFLFLSIPDKSRATLHLGLSFVFLVLFNLGYFIAGSFFHPLAAYHRWITVGVILFCETHSTMFMFHLHEERHIRAGRILLAVMYAGAVGITVYFYVKTFNAPVIYHFEGNYWDFDADAISKFIGVVIQAYLVIFIAVTAWKVASIKTRERWVVLLMGITYLIGSIVPSVMNVLSRDGAIDRGTFQITWDMFNIFGFFLLGLIYINFTRDKTTFMSKVVSITVVILLVILQGFSYFSFQDLERAYDRIHLAHAVLALKGGQFSDDGCYINAYHVSEGKAERVYTGDGSEYAASSEMDNLYMNAYLWERIQSLDDDGFRKGLESILSESHPAFDGYRRAIRSHLAAAGRVTGKAVLDRLAGMRRSLLYTSTKIGQMDPASFRDRIIPFLEKKGDAMRPFTAAVTEHLTASRSEGEALKREVRAFFSPLEPPDERRFRTTTHGHYIYYLQPDIVRGIVNEVGFSYLEYRAYLHPSAMKFIITVCSILVVVFIGFKLFFHRVLAMPLERLVQGIGKVEQGELDISIPVLEQDEIGYLTGSFNRMVATIRDARHEITMYTDRLEDLVSERTEELKKSEDRYRRLIVNANDIICTCDIRGNFKFMNPSGLKLLGLGIDEIVKKSYADLVPDDFRDIVLSFYREQMNHDLEETYYEVPVNAADGTVHWIGQNVTRIMEKDGTREYLCIARDITEKKKAEEALIELDRQKSRFFANVSHEIRTPLTLILSPVESVLQGDYGKKIDMNFFRNIHRNGVKLLKLINNLLDLSKIEAGRMTMKVMETDVVQFLRNYVGTVHSAAESKGIRISLSSTTAKLGIFVDVEKLDKIIMNIVSNALKFTEQEGTIHVTVSEDDAHCIIRISDTGMGIPAEGLEAIFDRFRQIDSGDTKKHEGTGIGLSLARELTEMHGGEILVESRYYRDFPDDHGTVFTVRLPKGSGHLTNRENVTFVADTELEESVSDYRFFGVKETEYSKKTGAAGTPAARGAASPVNESHPERSRSRILVVDDNDDMRNFLEFLLKKEYEVHFAPNGREGLERARELVPDLILSDVMMPVMDGYEMTRRLKEDERCAHIPVILITAKADIANKIEGLEFGADDYLTKPFNSKELLTRVRSLLKSYEYEKIILSRNLEIERELETARLLQRKLLPDSIIEIEGYETRAAYIPMDKVGGDFYDLRKENQQVEIFIADVSGHGLPGAFLSMITKMGLENISVRDSPGRVMKQLNSVVFRSTVNNNFVTAFFCVLDMRTNRLRFSNAGHCPPIIYRAPRDEFIELKTRGTPLGWFESIEVGEGEEQLSPGDRIIMYTDGITEAMDDKREMFGDRRFRDFIREQRNLPPAAFLDSLLTDLREFHTSGEFDDDATLIVFDVR